MSLDEGYEKLQEGRRRGEEDCVVRLKNQRERTPRLDFEHHREETLDVGMFCWGACGVELGWHRGHVNLVQTCEKQGEREQVL